MEEEEVEENRRGSKCYEEDGSRFPRNGQRSSIWSLVKPKCSFS